MMLEIHVLASGRHKKVTGLNCCSIVVIRKKYKKNSRANIFCCTQYTSHIFAYHTEGERESFVSDSYRSSGGGGGRGGVDPSADKLCHISIPGQVNDIIESHSAPLHIQVPHMQITKRMVTSDYELFMTSLNVILLKRNQHVFYI